MNKSTKKVIGIVIIILFVIAVLGAVYVSVKPKETSIQPSNKLLEESSNIINDVNKNEITNEKIENEIVNEISDEEQNKNEEVITNETDNTENDSETVEGTTLSREEKAVELAKKYYKEEYGSTDEIYFRYDSINGDGRYRVVASSNGKTVAFLLVDLDTETVTKK